MAVETRTRILTGSNGRSGSVEVASWLLSVLLLCRMLAEVSPLARGDVGAKASHPSTTITTTEIPTTVNVGAPLGPAGPSFSLRLCAPAGVLGFRRVAEPAIETDP